MNSAYPIQFNFPLIFTDFLKRVFNVDVNAYEKRLNTYIKEENFDLVAQNANSNVRNILILAYAFLS
jgi:hypothetical protein